MNNEIILVAGLINATGRMLYWKTNIEVNTGDYVIVENGSGHDLIKVIGIIKTRDYSASKFSNTKYENMKNIIQIVNLNKEEK